MAAIDSLRVKPGKQFRIADYDPDDTSVTPGDKSATIEKTAALTPKIAALQELLYAEHRRKLLIVLQGMDTSGKDSTIRHVMRDVSPISVRVVSFKKPTQIELDHDYLWRVHAAMPGAGEITIFNRSHYEDVLVVRVRELVPKAVWKKRYAQINDFEQMLSESGTTILKFFLHISEDEQRQRLQERLDDPTKQWKFQHGDLEERKLWREYQKAYEDAIEKTSTRWAPWTVVPANRKWVRNWVVAKTLVDTLAAMKMKYPKPDLSGVKIV